MPEPQATFVVEYDCDRRCRVEYDTTDVNKRCTHNQLLLTAKVAHDAAHRATPQVKVHIWSDAVLVKAGAR